MVGATTNGDDSTGLDFTVTSSAEELRFAARAGDMEHAQRIIRRYEGVSNPIAKLLKAVLAATDEPSGNSALHLCCANGHMQLVQLLLERGAPVDTRNYCGSTALHYASLTGQIAIVRELLARGAAAVVENNFGRTALDESRGCGHDDVAELLIAHVEGGARKSQALDEVDKAEEAEEEPSVA